MDARMQSIVLTAPGMDDLDVPILREGKGAETDVTVWKSAMRAIDQGDAAANWINAFLADERKDRKFRFVRVKDSFKRAVNPKYAPDHATGTSICAAERIWRRLAVQLTLAIGRRICGRIPVPARARVVADGAEQVARARRTDQPLSPQVRPSVPRSLALTLVWYS